VLLRTLDVVSASERIFKAQISDCEWDWEIIWRLVEKHMMPVRNMLAKSLVLSEPKSCVLVSDE
jgi:hypothetical protein